MAPRIESEKDLRARLKAEAPDHTSGKGYQAVVRDEDPETGESRAIWMGKAEHRTQKDALKTARARIDAECGRALRLEILMGRRQSELPGLLEGNIERTEDLKAQRKDITNAIKAIEEENAKLVRETCHPEIEIIMYEGTQTYCYAFTERGKKVEADERQLALFSEGVGEVDPDPDPGDDLPDIGDLASDLDDEDD